jgi:excinuclease ABC subunit A
MISTTLDQIETKNNIIIKGAKLNNLKNIDVIIPRNKLVVITGLSGSGKSTLAFDTLYAEGQRRYVESLSSYARQFLGKLNKPKVDYIKGISPAVAIEQKVNTTNARSTVGTSTEIYDYLKLLYSRIGKTFSPSSGLEVKKHQVKDVVDFLIQKEDQSKWLLLSPIHLEEKRTLAQQLNVLLQQGFQRIYANEKLVNISDVLNFEEALVSLQNIKLHLVVDRLIIQNNEDFINRLSDAVQIAFYEGKGDCVITPFDDFAPVLFSNNFSLDGITFNEPSIHLFSFNNPYGACETCNGYGNVIGIDDDLVIPNTSLSVYEGAIAPWKGESMGWYKEQLIMNAAKFNLPIHKPYFELTAAEKKVIWKGNKHFTGLNDFFAELEEKNYKIQNRVMLSRYRGKTLCKTCDGKRLRNEANYVKINNFALADLVDLPIVKLIPVFKNLTLSDYDQAVSKRLLLEINNRLAYLEKVGLGYLTLNRASATLSGGESQRINLATSLGSSLVGSMYILDEPSIGLHSKDTEKLIEVLEKLRDLGNTVIIVEHDEDIMKKADYIIDIGPEAGHLGGELVAEGTFTDFLTKDTLTAKYLNHTLEIEVPKKRRTFKNFIEIIGAKEHNLKNVDVKFPLDVLTVITGVSGSGKSTLVKKILYPAMQKQLTGVSDKAGQFNEIKGSFSHIKLLEYVDQNPIGKSSRSNPVTYVKAYDDIRELYAQQKLSKLRNYQAKHFSFNVDGGRCSTCSGDGEIIVEMQFMADVHLTCEACDGKRFKKEILEVKFEEKNIDDLLNMTIDEALTFFKLHQKEKVYQKLKPLQDVGLGYVKLGQSSSTLSGGEAQRVKLATFLGKGNNKEKTLFLFDEPTTGLHFHDIKKLLMSFEALIENGHSVMVIEHNLDLIKCADYVIDLGPEGGDNGGYVVATGTPEALSKNKDSVTGIYLKEKLG